MIPLQLKLENFLSYRQPTTLDLQGIHLACISGANGAGKSTLLDAMTYALFGQSRSKSDDDIVNRAAAGKGDAAEVRLIFSLDEATYRIIRRKRVGRSQRLELQLQIEAENWRALSEGGVRETQAAIETLLGMNYDTFVNASFLLQGRADEFTTKTANKRKEILADLLGLGNWDRYKAIANERRRQAEGQLQLINGRLEEIERELDLEPQRQAELENATASLTILSDRLESQEQILKQSRRTAAAVERQEQVVANLEARLTRERGELDDIDSRRSQRLQQRHDLAAILSEAEQIEATHETWQSLQAELEGWQARAEQYGAILEARRPHELAVQDQHSRLKQRRKELESRRQRIGALEKEREQKETALVEVKQQRSKLAERLRVLKEQQQAFHKADKRLQALRAERQHLQRRVEQLRKAEQEVSSRQQEQVQLTATLTEVTGTLQGIAERLTQVEPQVEQLASARAEAAALNREQPSLRQEMDQLKERMNLLQEASVCPLCGQALTDGHRAEVLAELEAEGRERGDRFRNNRQRLAHLKQTLTELSDTPAEKQRLASEQLRLQQRQAALKAQGAEAQRRVEQWEKAGALELKSLQEQLADEAAVAEQASAVAALQQEIADLDAVEGQLGALERRSADLEARLSSISAELEEWHDEEAGLAAELTDVVNRLDNESFAPEARQALAKLALKAEAIGYDPAAHQSTRDALAEVDAAPQRYAALERARAAIEPLDQTLTELATQKTAAEERIGAVQEQLAEAQAFLKSLKEGSVDVATVEAEVNKLREEEIEAHRRVATAEQSMAVLTELRTLREQQRQERDAKTQRIQRLKLLEKACGREGVQALLIERALPEIEDNANELLERLTGGQMRVTFETQRQLKTRDHLAETLDIRITDNQGERPYENYSGGEQFRVNFAIRLALSRILAKRAGARLETLVIDEGFGSQDPNGRQRLVEAINTVQEDFRRILVITHIDELRDAFPARIEVAKGPTGSVLTVI